MHYTIKAHETSYQGVLFRSRLEARWAAFFDLFGWWNWKYEPFDLCGWTPDFFVSFPCGHSECPNGHSLLIEVKPYLTIEEFAGHPCMNFPYGRDRNGHEIPADASAAFGNDPSVTYWEMTHGSGGGIENIGQWNPGSVDLETLWREAGNIVRYVHRKR